MIVYTFNLYSGVSIAGHLGMVHLRTALESLETYDAEADLTNTPDAGLWFGDYTATQSMLERVAQRPELADAVMKSLEHFSDFITGESLTMDVLMAQTQSSQFYYERVDWAKPFHITPMGFALPEPPPTSKRHTNLSADILERRFVIQQELSAGEPTRKNRRRRK